ncbi:hypothetical protein PG990_008937 [Apiospora arundinis]
MDHTYCGLHYKDFCNRLHLIPIRALVCDTPMVEFMHATTRDLEEEREEEEEEEEEEEVED